jgi:hypothetical protein
MNLNTHLVLGKTIKLAELNKRTSYPAKNAPYVLVKIIVNYTALKINVQNNMEKCLSKNYNNKP